MPARPSSPVADPAWRLWAVPGLAALGMAALLLPGANQAGFLALNQAAVALPAGFWSHVTVLGNAAVAAVILLPMVRSRPGLAAALCIAGLLILLGVYGLKALFDLPRPAAVLAPQAFTAIGPTPWTGAFPSAHSAHAFALAALLAAHARSRTGFVALILAAALVAVSRIAVGVHWPLDVLGGALLGWLAGLAGLALARRCRGCRGPLPQTLFLALLFGAAAWLLTGYDSGYPGTGRMEQAIAFAALVLFFRPGPTENSHA